MIDLSGRKILVTGGSRGIGAACCRLSARAGAAVVVHYRVDNQAAESVLESLAGDSDHLKIAADLQDAPAVERLFAQIRSAWGGLDCLVNNAGVWVHNPIASLDDDRLEETWRINVRGPFLCARHAGPLLELAEEGNIVNVSSTAGQRGEAFYSPYAASKGALISSTKSWSTELAPVGTPEDPDDPEARAMVENSREVARTMRIAFFTGWLLRSLAVVLPVLRPGDRDGFLSASEVR